MSDVATPAPKTAFTTFWIFRVGSNPGSQPNVGPTQIADLTNCVLERSETVSLRAAYLTTGLTAGADLILWLVANEVEAFQELALAINRTTAGRRMALTQAYLGYASTSQYDPNHGPAFLRGIPPKRFLSVYPFTKTPDWYLLPFEERRNLMIEHGKMGNEFPSILTNTVNSFGIADQEFVVALEDDDPATLIKMVQRLRSAEVRKYTQLDTPIFLGRQLPLRDALAAIL